MFILAHTLGLWWFYIFVMWLKKKRDYLWQQRRALYYFGYVVAFVFLVCDALYNVVIGTIMFVDLPREFLFTSRLKRYRKPPPGATEDELDDIIAGRRYRLATFFCEKMLNKFDSSGKHC